MVYGKAKSIDRKTKEERIIGIPPPELGSFSFNAAIYHRDLRFFEWDINSWLLEEPGDWNVCNKMLTAGVKMGFIDNIVTVVDFTQPPK